ncbi:MULTISPECIES: DUF4007 family protein [Bacteroidales]|uniref:DUF4007 family protein n=1 Tax=Lepagella muris TaxID=3032870 RepID=A0AC61RH03_9BACT|nr:MULTISPECIES: DUF4007 family protein [Bacteroidales]ROT09911.1 DUF4007 family protein [Muribaculaceae bacterium Isolate-037 (Harlan)]TGY77418.1 DUF4007 family protein [Lepagella muris]THG51942.1 DUF4007 family protein [Bacteroidales bacterium]TKC64273.1 DUF4007 family protein [Bacteroidales bacterium]
MSRYCFSGHESFQCKSLWLKKGYDFLLNGNRFSSPDSVAILGVGKNMVASIRFWLRAFGLIKIDEPLSVASYLFDSATGRDQYVQDINTIWLLHFLIVSTKEASLYNLLFVEYQREKKEFTKTELQNFIKRKCSVPEQKNVYNENTVRKDIGVLLKNYVSPSDLKSIEDFSSILLELNLIHKGTKGKDEEDYYVFREVSPAEISPEIILYALHYIAKGDRTISFDKLTELALTFSMPIVSLIQMIQSVEQKYPGMISFTDNSGVKNVQFLSNFESLSILDKYYEQR